MTSKECSQLATFFMITSMLMFLVGAMAFGIVTANGLHAKDIFLPCAAAFLALLFVLLSVGNTIAAAILTRAEVKAEVTVGG